MKIRFYLGETEIANCVFTEDNKIEEFNVISAKLTRILLKEFNVDRTCAGLHTILKFYMGGGFKLEEYLNHIIEYGFYSPYSKNFDIKIENNSKGEVKWVN